MKLFRNEELRKFSYQLLCFSIGILLIFFSIFVGTMKISRYIYINRAKSQLEIVQSLTIRHIDRNTQIISLETEIQKQLFLTSLKSRIDDVLKDRRHFDIGIVDDEHLLFMESQRIQKDIPEYIYYRLIFMESGFRMFDREGNILRSSGNALGYMQLLNSTFNDIKIRYDLDIKDVKDPYDNILAGTFYLRQRKDDIAKIFPGYSERSQWMLALAAYNAGIGRVIEYQGIPNIDETINYVNYIMRDYTLYANL